MFFTPQDQFIDRIMSCSRDLAYNRTFFPKNGIQKRRFSDIGSPKNGQTDGSLKLNLGEFFFSSKRKFFFGFFFQ
jgi:hypothetical protein